MIAAFYLLSLALGCGLPQGIEPSGDVPSMLCVVRHAQAYKNLDPVPEDLPPELLDCLTPEGEDQARALRDALPAGVILIRASPANRTMQTAELLVPTRQVTVEPNLRPLDGSLAWGDRLEAWAHGIDPQPLDGESLADGAARVRALLTELRESLLSGQHAVFVTHGDIAALLLGEIRGTPLLERPSLDSIETGQMVCLPLRE